MKAYRNNKTIHFVSRYESGQRSDSDIDQCIYVRLIVIY